MPSLEEIGYDERIHNIMVEQIKQKGLNDLEEIITLLTIGYVNLYGLQEPYEINEGLCNDFANDVKYLFPEVDVAWDDELRDDGRYGSHCVIIYDGLYYDSECPEGCLNLDDLPYFRRLSEVVEPVENEGELA